MTTYEKALALWKRKNVQTDAELAEALNGHSIAFAYHSGKMENDHITYHDTREIFEHDGVTGYTGDLRTLFEIRNAKEAYELFLCAFRDKRPLDEAFIRELQYQLTQSEVGAALEDVAAEMSELLEELQDITPDNTLTVAACFHAKFENIHPFADGNGRVGRLAMNYFLVLHGHPPIVIHEEDRRAYYEALEAWDERQDLTPLCAFLRTQTAKTWKKQIARMKEQL
ncbi:Fic family protein [Acutalibacter muris]|uniref:Fic family protein n=1 Tax=Acutalibacter muris TaxID=1796620 RepID=UPI00272E2708|nr:Fic family protein [Acutalibacter muris]